MVVTITNLLHNRLVLDVLACGLVGGLFTASVMVCFRFWTITINALTLLRLGRWGETSFGERLCVGIETTAIGTGLLTGLTLLSALINRAHPLGPIPTWFNLSMFAVVILLMTTGYWMHVHAAMESLHRKESKIFKTCIIIIMGGVTSTLLALVLTPSVYHHLIT